MIKPNCINRCRIAKHAAPGLCVVFFLAGGPLHAASPWGHDEMIAAGDPGITITGWSPISCTVKHWKDPGFPKAIHFDCVATINGRIANSGPSTHYRLRAWFMDQSEEKGHLPVGPSDINGDPLPTFDGNGDVSVRVEASGSGEEGQCPSGEYLVNDVHLEAVFEVGGGGNESYVDNKKGRVDVVCHG